MSRTFPIGDFTLADNPEGRDAVPAVVPGGVHESLLAAGRIPHPYAGRNERDVRWVEDRTWWYRTTLDLPGDLAPDERLRLCFDGLDTVATITLDGRELGRHENQFRPAGFDVTAFAGGRRELVCVFSPPLDGLGTPPGVADTVSRLGALMSALGSDDGSADKPAGVFSADLALTRRRKATLSWGWDLAPRLPTIGIWRPVRLVRERVAAITGHHVRALAVDGNTARVAVDVDVDAFAGAARVDVVLTAPDGTVTRLAPDTDGHAEADVTNAALWWTHDLGRPDRYAVEITLTGPDGTVLDTVTDRVGLRTIELDRTPDEHGRRFRFLLNGVPTFARGACWVPADMMIGSVPERRYRDLVGLARDANMTMLRVWAGGVYEHDAFYDACDAAGVLVWQDFPFACVDYPGDELSGEVALEASYQVRRLRNRACLALWCGNNEVHGVHTMAHRNVDPSTPDWGYRLFHDVLPAAVAAHSPEVPYWPGSPYGEAPGETVNGVSDGDRHAWEVWHGFDVGAGPVPDGTPMGRARHFTRYANDRGRFVSEFGLHAYPDLETLRRWLPADELYPHSPALDHHNKDTPKNKSDELLAVETGMPRDLATTVEFTQALQAEGLKFGVEHYRRQEPHTGGTLLWQLGDCWPGLTWSVVDHDLVPKAGYHAAARAYAPVAASARRTGDELEVWLANSTRDPVSTTLRVEVTTLRGEPVSTARFDVVAGPASASRAGVLPTPDEPDRLVWITDEGGHAPDNRWFPTVLKDLPLPADPLDVVVDRDGESARVTVTARAFAYAVRVRAPGARPDRDFLELRAGDSATVTLHGLRPDAAITADHYAERVA